MHVKLLIDPTFAQELADINNAAFGYRLIPNISAYQIRRCINDDRYDVYVIPDKSSIVGFLIVDNEPDKFILSPKEKCIGHFSISPWQQRNGVGKTLLGHVMNEVYPKDNFHLCVEAANKAVFLYEKFGFVSYGINHMVRSNNYIAMGLIR